MIAPLTDPHWAASYIGMPAPDCWAFARQVWAERFGAGLPVLPYDVTDHRALRRQLEGASAHGWAQVLKPAEGDAVLMTRGTRPCHVGIWIEPDATQGVLHWVETQGVVFTQPSQVPGLGYAIASFWRHPEVRS